MFSDVLSRTGGGETCSKCFTRSAVLRRHRRMHCRASGQGPEDFTQGVEPSDLDRSHSSDSFGAEMSVALLPVSVKFPIHPAGNSAEFDSSADSYCKLRSMVQQHGSGSAEKPGGDAGKALKAQAEPAPAAPFGYPAVGASPAEQPLQPDGVPLPRSSAAALHGPEPLASRGPYKSSEGPFFSSMTLWGLAMKTLQNESELEQ